MGGIQLRSLNLMCILMDIYGGINSLRRLNFYHMKIPREMRQGGTMLKVMKRDEEKREALVLREVFNHMGVLTLNRPLALNALNLEMIRLLSHALDAWDNDEEIQIIILKGLGERAFCSGGDLRSVYEAHQRQDHGFIETLFREEYLLDARIKAYRKPIISFVQGIGMGGGLGLAFNSQFCVLSSHARLAMPEVGIGFFPDVGASYFLHKSPLEIALYIGLLGVEFGAEDALYAGFATHIMEEKNFSDLLKTMGSSDIKTAGEVQAFLDQHAMKKSYSGFLETDREFLQDIFLRDSMVEIREKILQSQHPSKKKILEILSHRSPLSLGVTLKQLLRTKDFSFEEAIKSEFALGRAFFRGVDFYEGIRAAVIDKDRCPKWSLGSVAEVTPEMIEDYFSPIDIEPLFN